jgi:hypothetical protein
MAKYGALLIRESSRSLLLKGGVCHKTANTGVFVLNAFSANYGQVRAVSSVGPSNIVGQASWPVLLLLLPAQAGTTGREACRTTIGGMKPKTPCLRLGSRKNGLTF